MQTDTYDAQGNLITETQNSPGTSTSAGGGTGAPGAPGSVIYFVQTEPVPGQTVTGYLPQDRLLGPSGTIYPLSSN